MNIFRQIDRQNRTQICSGVRKTHFKAILIAGIKGWAHLRGLIRGPTLYKTENLGGEGVKVFLVRAVTADLIRAHKHAEKGFFNTYRYREHRQFH